MGKKKGKAAAASGVNWCSNPLHPASDSEEDTVGCACVHVCACGCVCGSEKKRATGDR